MAEQEKRTEVNTLGEFGLIDRLTENIQLRNKSTVRGVGDDAAVIDNGNFLTVVSTDMLLEGIHFDLMYTPLKHLGYKSVAVTIAISNRFSVEALEELYAGIYKACEFYNVDLVGGDTNSSNRGLIISVTAIGQGERDKLTYRSGARVGDLICITGNVGAAYLGLQILEREKQVYLADPDMQPELEKNQ